MTNYSLLSSRTFWTAAITFVYFGLTAIVPVFPNNQVVSGVVAALSFVLVSYFHINPSQTYNQPPV
jgi:alcohol dehydrogenase YqhD (iron-dependent ADH family)